MKKQKKSKLPNFKSAEEEALFWSTHDATEFADEFQPADVQFPKPQKKLISLRIADADIALLKKVASQKGIGYLTLIRMWVVEKLREESDRKAA